MRELSFAAALGELESRKLEKVKAGTAGLDIIVINQLGSKPTPSSEALEFIAPSWTSDNSQTTR